MQKHSDPDSRDDCTTASVQRYLDRLEQEPAADEAVRELLGRASNRLQLLCASLLHRKYPRLAQPPLNLETEELLSAVVERLIKALREARPKHVRQFFALASQHMRWELNDLARRLDNEAKAVSLVEEYGPTLNDSDSSLSELSRHILAAIDQLPQEQREAFDLVRIQGLSAAEAAEVLGVTPITIRRWLNRALQTLSESIDGVKQSTTEKI